MAWFMLANRLARGDATLPILSRPDRVTLRPVPKVLHPAQMNAQTAKLRRVALQSLASPQGVPCAKFHGYSSKSRVENALKKYLVTLRWGNMLSMIDAVHRPINGKSLATIGAINEVLQLATGEIGKTVYAAV
ncbi:hypothetical protein BGW80DRAFT_1250580 [Lactifluus volemus]|nr:hypothetical protein BGW80DRAFT_1250580 [Lactifluus volemus]